MLALALAVAGCGSSGRSAPAQPVRGEGFTIRAPHGWHVRRGLRTLAAADGSSLVSVTIFPLVRRYDPAMFDGIVPELDRVARQLAAREGAMLSKARTEQLAGRAARVYDLEHAGVDERIAFVLAGRREFQLYCRPAGGACDLLFSSFSLAPA